MPLRANSQGGKSHKEKKGQRRSAVRLPCKSRVSIGNRDRFHSCEKRVRRKGGGEEGEEVNFMALNLGFMGRLQGVSETAALRPRG